MYLLGGENWIHSLPSPALFLHFHQSNPYCFLFGLWWIFLAAHRPSQSGGLGASHYCSVRTLIGVAEAFQSWALGTWTSVVAVPRLLGVGLVVCGTGLGYSWHVGSLSGLGSNQFPLHCKSRFLTTGPRGSPTPMWPHAL